MSEIKRLADDLKKVFYEVSGSSRREPWQYPLLFRTVQREVEKRLSQQRKAEANEVIAKIKSFFQETRELLIQQQISDPWERLTTHLELVGKALVDERLKKQGAEWTPYPVRSIQFSDQVWKKASVYGVPRFGKDLAPVCYRGGAGRILARIVLGKKIPKGELPITDFDVVVDRPSVRVTLAEKIDPKGVKVISNLESNELSRSYFSSVDCDMNQIAVGYDRKGDNIFYYTSQAVQSLKEGIIRPVSIVPEDFYEMIFYKHPLDGTLKIWSPHQIERLIKFVIEEKARGFAIERHHVNRLPFDEVFLNLAGRFVRKEPASQPVLFWRFSRILEKMGICAMQSFFEYADVQLNQHLDDVLSFSLSESPANQREQANWYLAKIVNIALRDFEDPAQNVLKSYSTLPSEDERKEIIIDLQKTDVPDANFRKLFEIWKQSWLQKMKR